MVDGGLIEVGEIRFYAGPDSGPNQQAYWGSLFYFIGALLFQFAVLVPVTLGHVSPLGKTLLEWLPQALGGCCFTIAALIEWGHNRHATWRKHVWWLCITYLGGSLLFWFAASCGLYKSAFRIDNEQFALWLVDCPYAVGSMLFWVGAWFQMQARATRRCLCAHLRLAVAVHSALVPRTTRCELVCDLLLFRCGRRSSTDSASCPISRSAPRQSSSRSARGIGRTGSSSRSPHGTSHVSRAPESSFFATPRRVGSCPLLDPALQHCAALRSKCCLRPADVLRARSLAVVVLNIGVIGAHSSSGIGADVVAMRGPRLVKAGDVTSSVASLVASHSILLLTTILHQAPTLSPYDFLAVMLRIIASLFAVSEALKSIQLLIDG